MRRALLVLALLGVSASCLDLAPNWQTASPNGAVSRAPDPRTTTVGESVLPPLMGGTLLVTKSDDALVTDPNRDTVFLVRMLSAGVASLPLAAGSMPGRALEFGPGHYLVLLRGSGKVATVRDDGVELRLGEVFDVCAEPRGIARVPNTDDALVACGSGELVRISSTAVLDRQFIQPDLRDVVLLGGQPWVSTFRSAGLVAVAGGAELHPPDVAMARVFSQELRTFSPTVAWRVLGAGDTAVMVHQRAAMTNIPLSASAGVDGGFPGGGVPPGTSPYGGGSSSVPGQELCVTGDTVVHTAVTVLSATGVVQSRSIPGAVLPVDAALSPDGTQLAIAAAGSGSAITLNLAAPPAPGPTGGPCDSVLVSSIAPVGQVTGVGFLSTGSLVTHALDMGIVTELRPSGLVRRIPLVSPSQNRPFNVGHELFHRATPAGLACASCHPEARDDGHTFLIDQQPVRTQSLTGGLAATAPFHWRGEHADLSHVLGDTMVQRMGAKMPSPDETASMQAWLDAQPLATPVASRSLTSAGRAAFERAGCDACHSGARLTNNQTMDVGTGGGFQVPSLLGVSRRGPWMHDGCATTMRMRFEPACGGSAHGNAGVLTATELDELVAYLEAL